MTPGIYFDIPNEDYHAGDGVSKSQQDMVALSPALLQRQKSAPFDTEKLKALDMGMTVMDAEQGRKLQLMRDSAMAHPAARWPS